MARLMQYVQDGHIFEMSAYHTVKLIVIPATELLAICACEFKLHQLNTFFAASRGVHDRTSSGTTGLLI